MTSYETDNYHWLDYISSNLGGQGKRGIELSMNLCEGAMTIDRRVFTMR